MDSTLCKELTDLSADLGQTIQECDWDDDVLLTFNREDLNEALPGNKNLLIRKKAYQLIQRFKGSRFSLLEESSVSESPLATSLEEKSSNDEQPKKKALRRLPMESIRVVFPVYDDDELRNFEGKHDMPNHLITRLYQSTISNMITACQNLEEKRYPTYNEIEKMAKKLCKIYPGLLVNGEHESFYCKMKRRFQNKRPTRKPQGKVPKRSKFQREIPVANRENEDPNPAESVMDNSNSSLQHYQSEETLNLPQTDFSLTLTPSLSSSSSSSSLSASSLFSSGNTYFNLTTPSMSPTYAYQFQSSMSLQPPTDRSTPTSKDDFSFNSSLNRHTPPTASSLPSKNFSSHDLLNGKKTYPLRTDPFESRNLAALGKEMAKKHPDLESINCFLDLLYEKRKSDMERCESLLDRVNFIMSDYTAFKQFPEQVLHEVRRSLSAKNEKFVEQVMKRLERFALGIIYFAIAKVSDLHCPPVTSASSRLLMVLPFLDVIFEPNKRRESKKKKSPTITIVEGMISHHGLVK